MRGMVVGEGGRSSGVLLYIANSLCHCMQTLGANVTLQTILQCDNYLRSNFIYNPRKPEKRCFPEIAVKDRGQADNIIH